MLTKANSRSTVHRIAHLDYVGVKEYDERGEVIGERRFLGLYASTAYTESVQRVPLVAEKVQAVLDRSGVAPDSHTGKDLLEVLESYPRDELIQASIEQLYDTAMAVTQLQERRRTKLFIREDDFGRFVSCLVYIPRDRYNTGVRLRMADILKDTFGGESVEFSARVSESALSRLQFVVRVPKGRRVRMLDQAEQDALEQRLVEVSRTWSDRLGDALRSTHGEEAGDRLMDRFGRAFPTAYEETFTVNQGQADLAHLDRLGDGQGTSVALYRPADAPANIRRFKLFRVDPLSLTDILPIFTHMGVEVVDEQPFEVDARRRHDPARLRLRAARARRRDLGGLPARPAARPVRGRRLGGLGRPGRVRRLQPARPRGPASPGARSSSCAPSRSTCARPGPRTRRTTSRTPSSRTRPSPATSSSCGRCGSTRSGMPVRRAAPTASAKRRRGGGRRSASSTPSTTCPRSTTTASSARSSGSSAPACARTSTRTGATATTTSRTSRSSSTPRPCPTCRPRARSSRSGSTARASRACTCASGRSPAAGCAGRDRREDFRTEILGLVKAQMVKNAVIVPTGSKGGFYPKQLPDPAVDREAWLEEGKAAYRMFISGLLDITDNRVSGAIVPPERVVRHDGDDPYLVVAADKGTATFSDIANGVAQSYGFWLDDAFASGGSAGYDHKAMGITARGAWESVKRHFREMGVDTQSEDFTVVGVGDMSGDVFGNGMLLSEHIRLVAAFDHRHVFVDPNPVAAPSFAERQRLFELPRSSWDDYDTLADLRRAAASSRAA